MKEHQKGSLFLIPSLLGETGDIHTIPALTRETACRLDEFIVENEKTARHFLKRIGIKTPLPEVKLYPLNTHTSLQDISSYLTPLLHGKDMGLISEAGCPAIADPGADIVKIAHEKGIRVIPLVGPSSILLSLMASGLNGQHFTFHGYLPKDRNERIKKIKKIERESKEYRQTQIFIETPYRNNHLLEDLLQHCAPGTRLCIAAELTLPEERVVTKEIAAWQKGVPDLNKKPTVFLLSA